MTQGSIFVPFFGVMLLTIAVWFYMYYLRLTFMKRNRIAPESLATSDKLANVIPAKVNMPSENLMNLFELPVLFYGTCIYLYVTSQVDIGYLILAYLFLVLRVGHSVVHCTYNKVMHRFYFYFFSSIALWVLIIRAFVGAL